MSLLKLVCGVAAFVGGILILLGIKNNNEDKKQIGITMMIISFGLVLLLAK